MKMTISRYMHRVFLLLLPWLLSACEMSSSLSDAPDELQQQLQEQIEAYRQENPRLQLRGFAEISWQDDWPGPSKAEVDWRLLYTPAVSELSFWSLEQGRAILALQKRTSGLIHVLIHPPGKSAAQAFRIDDTAALDHPMLSQAMFWLQSLETGNTAAWPEVTGLLSDTDGGNRQLVYQTAFSSGTLSLSVATARPLQLTDRSRYQGAALCSMGDFVYPERSLLAINWPESIRLKSRACCSEVWSEGDTMLNADVQMRIHIQEVTATDIAPVEIDAALVQNQTDLQKSSYWKRFSQRFNKLIDKGCKLSEGDNTLGKAQSRTVGLSS